MLENYFAEVKTKILAHSWKMEIVIFAISIGTIILYIAGSYWNKSKLENWINAQAINLQEQFFQVGVTPKKLFIQDDDQHYTSYATGRVNIAKFIINITLQARQNFSVWIMEHVFGFFTESIEIVEDEVEIVANLHSDIKVDPFIFSIVNKENMSKKRKDNYYLSLTRTADSDKLPVSYVYMSESAEINDLLYSDELKAVLADSADIIQLLAFTDQPALHPFSLKKTEPKFRAILKLNLKSDSASLAKTSAVINEFIKLIDFISSKNFKVRPDVFKKIQKVRDAEYKKLEKLIEQDKREQLEEKKLEELKKQKEQMRNLSPKELEKIEKKQREKQQRKLMKKQRVRG